MERHRYSGYLADDESLREAQMGYLHGGSHRRGSYDWRRTPRPPSRCQFRSPDAATSSSTSPTFPSVNQGKRKHRKSATGSARENSHLANEFSEFVDFLADEDVLESLQAIVEDAVRKLRNMTTGDGDPVFDIQDDSSSSAGSTSWSFSYSSSQTQSKYYTTTTPSSSEEERGQAAKRRRPARPESRMCLLEKYATRLPRLGKKTGDMMSGGFHAETFSERSGDSYFFRQEHFHIWAKLAESFEKFQPPKKDYFAKFRKEVPSRSLSVESLQKEITSVLKRPTPSSIPLYYPGHQPFDALDFLEENKILAALQDIINAAVLQVLEMRGADGTPLLDLFDEEGRIRMLWESSITGSDEEEGEEEEEEEEGDEEGDEGGEGGEGEESSGSGEETSEEDDSKSGGSKSSGKKKKKKGKKKGKGKGKKKKGKAESPAGDEKSKGRYTPPPLPKTRAKSPGAEESQRKAKYVPPPLPKTKPRAPQEEPPPKPKYTPPPLPKPKQKKPDSTQAEAEAAPKQVMLTKNIITPKDIKRARLQARPPPKQSIIDFLIENAAKLILYKYNYETLLSEKLGFISVPVTKTLLEIMFGYKKVRGSGIRLSSQIDWSKVYDEIYAVRPPKPKTPKLKPGGKKKAKDKKAQGKEKEKKGKKSEEKKSVLLKTHIPKGKVVVIKAPVDQESVEARAESTTEAESAHETQIFEIVPPQFPEEGEMDEMSANEEGEDSLAQLSQATPKGSGTSMALRSPQRSVVSEQSPTKLAGAPVGAEVSSPALSLKKSLSSQRAGAPGESNRGSRTFLPEVGPAGQPSEELLKKASSSRKASWTGNGSKTVLPKISS